MGEKLAAELRAGIGEKLAPYVSVSTSLAAPYINTYYGHVAIEVGNVEATHLKVAQAVPLLHVMLATGLLDELITRGPAKHEDEEEA